MLNIFSSHHGSRNGSRNNSHHGSRNDIEGHTAIPVDGDQTQTSTSNPQPNHIMGEDEVRKIMAEFNQNMNVVLLENEELKAKIDALHKENRHHEDHINSLIEEKRGLEQEKGHYQQLCHQYEEKLNQKEKEFVAEELERCVTLKDIGPEEDRIAKFKEIIEADVTDQSHKETLLNLVAEFDKMNKDMSQFSFKFEHLVKENERLNEEIVKVTQEHIGLRHCTRCREKFSPLLNTEHSCVYHSGKLKYYSCRGCGADEYWACCNRCTNCLKGCREGKHLTVA